MLATVIVLSALLVLLILFLIVLVNSQREKIEQAKKKGADEFFEAILQGGFQKRVNDFKVYNKSVKEGGIVFVGDSLTENYNVYEYFKEYDVYNRGIGGDTTVGLLSRMDESIYALKPKIVVLLIGINDFELVENSTVDTIYENISKIVKEIRENCPNTKIILESLYPVYKKEASIIDVASVMRKDNQKIREVNEKIKNLNDVIYLDVNSKISDSDGDIILDYTMEGLHVNSKGYEYISKLIKEVIKNILGE